MSNKKQILRAIVSLAKELGHSPALSEFMGRTGITKYRVTRFFSSWNEAVRAAGLAPGRLYTRPDDSELLEDWGATVRKKRTAPSRRAYLLEGKFEPRTVEKRFGSWEAVPQAFRRFAEGKPEWADVVALLAGPLPVWRPGRPRKNPPAAISPNNGERCPSNENLDEGTIYRAPTILRNEARRALRDRPSTARPSISVDCATNR
jgi:Homing endonuclease associated repeat